jgi:hypothetical protein
MANGQQSARRINQSRSARIAFIVFYLAKGSPVGLSHQFIGFDPVSVQKQTLHSKKMNSLDPGIKEFER